jgi:hypothetical protein
VVGVGLGWVVQGGCDGVGGFFCRRHLVLDLPKGRVG